MTQSRAEGSEAEGEDFVVGVWEEGGHPRDTQPIAGAAATDTIASGAATVTIPPWDGMQTGTQYDVCIIIAMGELDGGPDPTRDYFYNDAAPVKWLVDGDRTIDTTWDGYEIPEPPAED